MGLSHEGKKSLVAGVEAGVDDIKVPNNGELKVKPLIRICMELTALVENF
jgi:hypothetical protein